MKIWKPHLTLITFSCLLLVGLAERSTAQDPELIVDMERREIYTGESVLYRVTLNHVQNPTAPQLDGFDELFQVVPLGEQSLDSRQLTIINGRRTEIIRRGRQYNYQLTPRRSGTLTIPAPTATVDGAVLTGKSLTLRVLPPDDQDAVRLSFTTDHTAVYPRQPFTLTLTVAVQALPGDLQDRDPLTVQPQPPALEVSWLADNQLPQGLQPQQSWRDILEPLVSRRGHGFQINNIGTSSVFSLFEDTATGFHPQPQRTTLPAADGADVEYWEYRLQRTLIPQKIGKYEFGPVLLKGTFANDIQDGQLVGRRIYAFAPGLEVTVRDVPLPGRPAAYVNVVGRCTVQAALVPATARVGDPMTLTVTLAGPGNLADARPPDLATLPGLKQAFRIYDATRDASDDVCRFTYSVRPLQTQVTEFPAIPLAYFDTATEQYVTIHTDPLPVTILEAETVADAEIVSAAPQTTQTPGNLELSAGGIFANATNLNALRNDMVRPARWLASWVGMLIGWFVVSQGIRYVQRLREDPARLRRRAAPAQARSTLAAATQFLDAGNAAAGGAAVRQALTGLIADYANVPAAGLTPRDAADRLAALGVTAACSTRVEQLLEACDAARYGAAMADLAPLHSEASTLLDQLIAELKKSQFAAVEKITTLLVLGLWLVGCSSAPDLQSSQKFQQVEQAFGQAHTPAEFAQVARQYEPLCRDAFVSGAVLYNQGNAWMRAGEIGRAIAAYRQAVRYRPRDPYLQANLRNALAAVGQDSASSAPSRLMGYLFFWQNWLSYPEKFVVTTLLLAAALATALLGQLTSHRLLWQRSAWVCGALAVLAGLSTGWDWQRFDRTVQGVVIADEVVARKGNSENYAAAFTEQLQEGMEFVVLEKRQDWLHVQVGAAGTGWLPARDVVTY